MPESIVTPRTLEELNLSYNKITILPESIRNLASLQILNIANNQLTTLPDSLFYNHHHSCRIELSSNHTTAEELVRLMILAASHEIRLAGSVYEAAIISSSNPYDPVEKPTNQTNLNFLKFSKLFLAIDGC